MISLIYVRQPDWLAAVTLAPAWCWLIPACLLAVLGMSRKQKFWSALAIVSWVVFTVVFVEEADSLLRRDSGPTADWIEACEEGRGIRIVSLNCAVANWRAAAEVAAWDPDIVLLQESPTREHLAQLANELYGEEGSYLWGGDTSILARGEIHPLRMDRSSHFVHAKVKLSTGVTMDVVSVRLNPPVFRLDFWMPGFWQDHRNNRLKHRQQILDVVQGLGDGSTPLIVGGDFNAPPNDAALDPLEQRLDDTFCVAGRGWGNTGTNGSPLFRVDQIWASRQFNAERVVARKTVHSDHRLVVCDLILR